MAELLYSSEENFSIKRSSKFLVFFGILFSLVKHKRSKFLMGTLFAMGGLMKIEAKSYLKTISERRENY